MIGRQISEQDDLLESLGLEEKALAEERTALDVAWAELWSGVSVAPAGSRRDDRVAARTLRDRGSDRADSRRPSGIRSLCNSVKPKPNASSWPNLMRWGFP